MIVNALRDAEIYSQTENMCTILDEKLRDALTKISSLKHVFEAHQIHEGEA